MAYVVACRQTGLIDGFYYSLEEAEEILEWARNGGDVYQSITDPVLLSVEELGFRSILIEVFHFNTHLHETELAKALRHYVTVRIWLKEHGLLDKRH